MAAATTAPKRMAFIAFPSYLTDRRHVALSRFSLTKPFRVGPLETVRRLGWCGLLGRFLVDVPGSFDLAAVFGDGYDTFPLATGGNFLVEILPALF